MKKKSSKSISKDKDKDKSKSKSKSKSKEKADHSSDKSVKSGKSGKSLKAKLTKKKSTTTSKADDSSALAKDASPNTSKLDIIPQESTRLEAKTALTSFPGRDLLSQQTSAHQKPERRCDGCFEGEAAVFCKDCSKQFCKICEDQIHIIPVHRNHQRIPVTDLNKLNKLCYHHDKPLVLYCETCNETICEECQIIGPHNNKLHRISDIMSSFKKKYYQIATENRQLLVAKYHQLERAQEHIDDIFEKIRVSKKGIERDLRTQYSTLLEKVQGIEGKKVAVLSYESSQLQNQLNSIQDLIILIKELSGSDSPDMISFLLRYNQINDSIENIMNKPFKEPTALNTIGDFPNDLAVRHKKIEEFDLLQKKMEKKNDTIWDLLIERKEKEDKDINDFRDKSKNDIAEWVKLSDRYALEIKKYNVVCSFCGKYLDDDTINTQCESNEDFALSKFFTKKSPLSDAINSKKHYFSEPVENLNEALQQAEKELQQQKEENEELRLKEEAEKIARAKRRKKPQPGVRRSFSYSGNRSMLENFIKKNSQIENWVIKMATHISNKNIDFLQMLRDIDSDRDGYLKPDELKVVFLKLDGNLEQIDFDNMLAYFKLSNINKIKIVDFAKNFRENSHLLMSARSRTVTESID